MAIYFNHAPGTKPLVQGIALPRDEMLRRYGELNGRQPECYA